jgi:hypothetical protein
MGVRLLIARVVQGKRRRGLLMAGLAAIALTAGLGRALVAHARRSDPTAPVCIPYSTGRIPASTRCMNLPWQLVEVGANARSIVVTVPADCFGSASGEARSPRPVVHETSSAIHIRMVTRGHPTFRHGRLDTTCSWSVLVQLHAPIRGRRLDGQSWPSHLRFGGLRRGVVGLPRLLGLSPAQALHLLWLEGFHARLMGTGREVVAQLPGWGLTSSSGRSGIDSYDDVATVTAGDQVAIPTTPALKPGARTGLAIGTLSPRTPGAEPVAVFDSSGRLLARRSVPGEHRFRLTLPAGRYLLLEDTQTLMSCPPGHVHVRAGHVTRVDVGFACDIP